VAWPTATTPAITIEVALVDGDTGSALPGAVVTACANTDTQCLSPLSSTTTDSDGIVKLVTPAPFTGYLQTTASGYPTQLSYIYPSLAETMDGPWVTIHMVSETQLGELAAILGVTPDPSLGLIVAEANDCVDQPAPGVSFSASPLGTVAVPYYFVSGFPSNDAGATSLPDTLGGFANVAPGLITFVAEENATVVFTMPVNVRANTVTYLINLVPAP
jgi:hypothetical protein